MCHLQLETGFWALFLCCQISDRIHAFWVVHVRLDVIRGENILKTKQKTEKLKSVLAVQ